MKTRKPFLLLAFITLLLNHQLIFALPGLSDPIPDTSGEYAYYKDSSFARESYVGIVYYNDTTYAFRYYAPANIEGGLEEKDITLYFTIDNEVDFLSLTGERIEGSTSNSDTDIINYLHDIFYEFTARRQKFTFTKGLTSSSKQDFEQFGGNVTITFNKLVPIFNIESIKAADGKEVFTLQTLGRLVSSDDKSFSAFKGLPIAPKDKERNFTLSKKSKSSKAQFEGLSVNIDSSWEQKMENIWALGDASLLTLMKFQLPQDYADKEELFECLILRSLSEGSNSVYPIWKFQSLEQKKGKFSASNLIYQAENADLTRSFIILNKNKDKSYSLLSITVFDSIYQKNASYFKKIVKSFK